MRLTVFKMYFTSISITNIFFLFCLNFLINFLLKFKKKALCRNLKAHLIKQFNLKRIQFLHGNKFYVQFSLAMVESEVVCVYLFQFPVFMKFLFYSYGDTERSL